VSVAAPASEAWRVYADWEQERSRQWETFLSRELPDDLAASKGLAAGGHGIVGAAQDSVRARQCNDYGSAIETRIAIL